MDKHQELMDSAYDKWQKEWKGIGYVEFISNLNETERDAVVLGNLNYQVHNGGWKQWVDNGYCYTLNMAQEALEKVGTDNAKEVSKMLETMRGRLDEDKLADPSNSRGWNSDYWAEEYCEREEECHHCGGDGFTDDGDCDECGGTGTITEEASCPDLEVLDDAYVAISEKLMEECNEFFIRICSE